jgi:protein-tyrosine sulfotransferase
MREPDSDHGRRSANVGPASSGSRPYVPSDTVSPTFILSAARSGSTLLRYIFDAHPSFACPPETNLCLLFQTLEFTARHASADLEEDQLREVTDDLCRVVVHQTIGAYAARHGKERWCEKSLPSIDAADSILRVFPNATFVCLYRQCKDTIASLIDASPWGFGAFGVEPYVRMHPDNLVLALAKYWTDRTERMQAFEKAHPASCFRLRYEDLVTSSSEACRSLFSGFLKADWDDAFLDCEQVFTAERKGQRGPGDVKILYTSRIESGSIGRGWSVPMESVPQPLLRRINRAQIALGYPRITARISAPMIEAVQTPHPNGNGADHDAVRTLFTRRLRSRLREHLEISPKAQRGEIKIVVRDGGGAWVVDLASGRVEQSTRRIPATFVTDAATLLAVANGDYNPAIALKRREIVPQNGSKPPGQNAWKQLDRMLSLMVQ